MAYFIYILFFRCSLSFLFQNSTWLCRQNSLCRHVISSQNCCFVANFVDKALVDDSTTTLCKCCFCHAYFYVNNAIFFVHWFWDLFHFMSLQECLSRKLLGRSLSMMSPNDPYFQRIDQSLSVEGNQNDFTGDRTKVWIYNRVKQAWRARKSTLFQIKLLFFYLNKNIHSPVEDDLILL